MASREVPRGSTAARREPFVTSVLRRDLADLASQDGKLQLLVRHRQGRIAGKTRNHQLLRQVAEDAGLVGVGIGLRQCLAHLVGLLNDPTAAQFSHDRQLRRLRKTFDQRGRGIVVATVEKQARETSLLAIVAVHAAQNIVGRVDRHVFFTGDEKDRVGVFVTQGNAEPAADHIAQDVVENDIELVGIHLQFLKQFEGSDDSTSRTTDTGSRAPGFNTQDAAKAFVQNVLAIQSLGYPPPRRQNLRRRAIGRE